jgi:cleavage and polyadenylation specificity factor subunit 2
MLEADDLDSDSDSDEDDDLAATDNLLAIGNDARGGDSEIQMSFDIFVKGQQMRVTRGKEDQGGRFRMFPYMERRGKKVDAYGETLDVGQWVRKGREIEESGETKEVSDAKKKKEDEGKEAVSLTQRDMRKWPDTVVGRTGDPFKVYHRYKRRRYTCFSLARRHGRSA